MKNFADLEGSCPPRLKAKLDNILLDLRNSSSCSAAFNNITEYTSYLMLSSGMLYCEIFHKRLDFSLYTQGPFYSMPLNMAT